ncbi:MAG TPA: EamA family transporter, partial [Clostridium sp.]|nr:EamA family transporter [Clostridium sp.]
GLMFSVLFLGEQVTIKLAAGCVLMFASVILSEYKRKGSANA